MKSLDCWLLGGFCSILLMTPLYGQNFEDIVNELSGSEASDADQVESEQPLAQGELPPSSTDLISSPEEDLFAPEKNIQTTGVILQGLDKPTARVFITNATIGQTIKFGTLKIVVHRCEKAPLDDRQESKAFVTIMDAKPNTAPQRLFSGWMFASSPALSSFDHPTYDVWIKECKDIDVPPQKKLNQS